MKEGEDPRRKWHVQEGNSAAETWRPLLGASDAVPCGSGGGFDSGIRGAEGEAEADDSIISSQSSVISREEKSKRAQASRPENHTCSR